MTAEQSVQIGSGPFWSWVSVTGLGLATLLFLAIAVAMIGYAIFKAEPGMRQVWVGGVVALLFVPFFVSMIRERFVRVARIEVDGRGGWRLRSPAGREVAALGPATLRSLSLWSISTRSSSASRTHAALYGFIEAEGRRFQLEDATKCWDLLRQLGYGDVLIYSPDAPPELRGQAEAGRWLSLRLGGSMEHAFRLPEHRFDAEGRTLVARFLAEQGS